MTYFNEPITQRHYDAWVCEQIGVDYDGLPLCHQHKQRFIALKKHKPYLEYPGMGTSEVANVKIKEIAMTVTRPTIVHPVDAETSLLAQYDKDLGILESKIESYYSKISLMESEIKSLRRKRAAFAKLVGREEAKEAVNT